MHQEKQSIHSVSSFQQWNVVSDSILEERHNHAAYELYIITSGECSLSVNNTELTLSSNQGVLIAPEVFHASRSVTAPFTCISAAYVLNESMMEHAELLEQGHFWVFSVDHTIKDLCQTIMEEAEREDDLFQKELIDNQFTMLILRVLRSVKGAPLDQLPAQEPPVPQDDMSVIDRFFRATPPEQRTKENLAALLHCSERHALRKVYELYGMSFREKKMLSRIDTAKHLLVATNKSIEEICGVVGYADRATLCRAFNLYANTTPIKYRREARRDAQKRCPEEMPRRDAQKRCPEEMPRRDAPIPSDTSE